MQLTGFNNLPGGAPERIKRGKEKVVTRAVANAGMKLIRKKFRSGVTRHCQNWNELNKKPILMVQQFLKLYIMESLILAQNERWRRG